MWISPIKNQQRIILMHSKFLMPLLLPKPESKHDNCTQSKPKTVHAIFGYVSRIVSFSPMTILYATSMYILATGESCGAILLYS